MSVSKERILRYSMVLEAFFLGTRSDAAAFVGSLTDSILPHHMFFIMTFCIGTERSYSDLTKSTVVNKFEHPQFHRLLN